MRKVIGIKFVVAVCLVFYSVISIASPKYSGIWETAEDKQYLWAGVEWKNFNSKWKELSKKNLRLIDIETYVENGKRKYSGVWREGSGGHYLWAGLEWKKFNKKWKELSKKKYRLIDIETYVDKKKRKYIGVWRKGKDAHYLYAGVSWKKFQSKWKSLSKKKLRLIDIETYGSGKNRKYIGVWRAGKGGYYLWAGKNWKDFKEKWQELSKKKLRLVDIESYKDKKSRKYIGVWKSEKKSHYLWHNVEWENFVSKWSDLSEEKKRLIDLEILPGCVEKCMNQVVAGNSYVYGITGHDTKYRWPANEKGERTYVRLSALDIKDQFLTLPFSDKKVKRKGIWRYKGGDYHHAGDYSRGVSTFRVKASAKGKVIFIGWDNWSGNTMILSHDVGRKKDAYRTIYMHLRDGRDNDCKISWLKSMNNISGDNKEEFKTHLTETGCSYKVADRDLDSEHWGKNSETINRGLLNKTVSRGKNIAWAGNTGPGGKRGSGAANTHLHIFWVRKDPTNGEWYFFDPYGIYATPECYPEKVTDKLDKSCVRYPVVWKNGRPSYP